MLQELRDNGLIECDVFILLTADYDVICKRNNMRKHMLEGIWLEEETIIKKGDCIGQASFEKFLIVDNDEADGERKGGFGSTNK